MNPLFSKFPSHQKAMTLHSMMTSFRISKFMKIFANIVFCNCGKLFEIMSKTFNILVIFVNESSHGKTPVYDVIC